MSLFFIIIEAMNEEAHEFIAIMGFHFMNVQFDVSLLIMNELDYKLCWMVNILNFYYYMILLVLSN